MKTNIKETIENVRRLQEKVSSLTQEVAQAEAAIVIAELNLTKAEKDDGSATPEHILERAEKARRELSIRKIEANRAAAKLEETEPALERAINKAVPEIERELSVLISKAAEDTTAKVLEIVGDHLAHDGNLRGLINSSAPVVRILSHTRQVTGYFSPGVEGQITRAKAILNAATLL